jgi:hypothetical protein
VYNILAATPLKIFTLHRKGYIESVLQSPAVKTKLYGFGIKDKNVEVWEVSVFHFSSYLQRYRKKKCMQKAERRVHNRGFCAAYYMSDRHDSKTRFAEK